MNAHQGNRRRTRSAGIEQRQTASGAAQFRGTAFDKRASKKLRGPWTSSPAEARSWRVDAMAQIAAGTLSGNRGRTLKAASEDFTAQAKTGGILNRNGQKYKPSAVRGLEGAFRLRILPTIGPNTRLGDIQRHHIQAAIDRWRADGLSPSGVRNTVNALRALMRHAERRGEVLQNPCRALEMPRVTGKRDRIATPAVATLLIAALSGKDRAIYSTAFFAGLRLGELRALRWQDVDTKLIHVERNWDPVEGPVEPKSEAGRRVVPLISPLRAALAEHRLACPWSGDPDGLVFGSTATRAFSDAALNKRAAKAWEAVDLEHYGLHEARHTMASWFIGAGVNLKAISTYMGHSSITVTIDRYGHLLPGDEELAAGQVDRFLAAAEANA